MLISLFLATVVAGSFAPPFQEAQTEGALTTAPVKRVIGVADFAKLAQVTGIQLAPDGSFAIASVRRIHGDPSERGGDAEYRTHLLWLDVQGTRESRYLTGGERGAHSPAISPDGTHLAFVRPGEATHESEVPASSEGPVSQIWLMPLEVPGEARQLSSFEHGAVRPRWYPDGKSLLVESSIPQHAVEGELPWDSERVGGPWPEERERPEEPAVISAEDLSGSADARRRWLARARAEEDPFVFSSLEFQAELGLAGEPTYRHLWRIAVADGSSDLVLGGFHDPSDVELAQTGERILFTARPPGRQAPDRVSRTALWALDNGDSQPRVLLDLSGWSLSSPKTSADASKVFLLASDADDPLFAMTRLASLDLASGEFELLTEQLDAEVEAPRPGNSRVCFRVQQGGTDRLLGLDLESGELLAPIAEPEGSILAWDFVADEIVYAASTAANPGEVYRSGAESSPAVLSDLHRTWLEDIELSIPAKSSVTRPDGTVVDHWVMPPVGLAEGASAPLVVEMHGGPQVMWGPGSFTMWHEWQLLCAQGFGVVYANPRGSAGYGEQFQRNNYRDWGTGPAGDVLASVDEALGRFDWIDPDRLYLTGGSYAGYLTAWIVAHDERFQAAVAQRGVYDLNTFFGEGNAFRLVEWAFGGFPWEPEVREVLARESPFTTVDQINTPLLIMHSSSDLRTGVSQSEMMYRALKELRRPVEYVRYPGAGHDLSRTGEPTQRLDRLLRILEFFERHGAHGGKTAPFEAPAGE